MKPEDLHVGDHAELREAHKLVERAAKAIVANHYKNERLDCPIESRFIRYEKVDLLEQIGRKMGIESGPGLAGPEWADHRPPERPERWREKTTTWAPYEDAGDLEDWRRR